MKTIDTSNVTSSARQPLLGRSITHLNEGIVETFNSVLKNLLTNYTTNDVVILEGLVDSGTAGVNYNISAGSVYYNGEVYQVATGSGTFAGTVAVLTATTTYQSGDPVTMTDGTLKNVHKINTMVISNAATGSGTKDYTACKKMIANPVFAKLTTVNTGAASTSFTFTGWDASPIDDDGIFTIATGRITPKLGRYKISACVTATPSTNPTGSYEINIYKNGVLFDLICSDSFLGTNASRVVQFNNYVITQTTATDYYTIVMTTVSGTYTYTSVQLTVEPLGNVLMKPY